MVFHGLIDGLDVRQPALASFIINPALIAPMLRVLYALQHFQKGLQVVTGNDEVLNAVSRYPASR